jgi:hypothetical protein
MIDVEISAIAVDACSPPTSCAIASISSSERSLQMAPDWLVMGPLAVQLRAECSGQGQGRIYTISVICSDASANSSAASANVIVPHDQRLRP